MLGMSDGTFHLIETIAIIGGVFGNFIYLVLKVSGRLSIMENNIEWIIAHLGIDKKASKGQ